MDKKSNNIVIQLKNYREPKIIERRTKKWVEYGEDNDYFNYLIEAYNNSTTNNAIINGITAMIYGKGLGAEDANIYPESYAQMKTLFKKEVLRRSIFDLKTMGNVALELIYNKERNKIVEVNHIPVEQVRAGKVNDDGEIDTYFHSTDWTVTTGKNAPVAHPAFTFGKGKDSEILYIKPYRAGYYYYSPTDYTGGLVYAKLEAEIANYHINNIMRNFSATAIVNFNNGQAETEKQKAELAKSVKSNMTGTDGDRVIISFNEGVDSQTTMETVQLSNASEQYQFLSDEATKKLMVSHRITSTSLFGLSTDNGFASNADELKNSAIYMEHNVISSFQELLLDELDKILQFNGINLKLKFEKNLPKEWDTEDTTVATEATKLSADNHDHDLELILEKYAEDTPEGYDLHSIEYDLTTPSEYELASTSNSEQDTKLWKVRYSYQVGTSKTPEGASRTFCNKMMSLSKAGKVYRKEDIDKMSADGINGQFAHSGGKYNIFLYGGGVNCYHRFERRIFKKRRDDDGKELGGNAMQNTFPVNVNEARRQGAKLPQNPADVAIAEIDKANNGRVK